MRGSAVWVQKQVGLGAWYPFKRTYERWTNKAEKDLPKTPAIPVEVDKGFFDRVKGFFKGKDAGIKAPEEAPKRADS